MAAIDRLQQLANPMGAIAQATEIAGAQERLSALRERRQNNAQDRLLALQDRQIGLEDHNRKMLRDAMSFAAQSAPYIESGKSPEEQSARYKEFRNLSRLHGFPDVLPPEYSPEVQRRLNMAQSQLQAPITPYQRENLDLQSRRLDEAAADRAESRTFRQQQLDAQTANQQALNDIRQQQVGIQRQATEARETEAQTRRDAAAQKKKLADAGLEQELISLEGVLADVNRAEELLKNNGNLTGPLVGRSPSLSAEAQELESLTQALGIGALQQFKGATSEKELAAALRSGLSMTADALPNLKRLAAQKAVIQRNIDRIRGLRGDEATAAPGNTFQSSSGIQFTVE